ncbi:MAG: FliG C-terminal domain-containing protein, partial [Gemmataceae bacterium]
EPPTAAAVLKGLPAEQRVDVAVRFSLPGTRNYQLLQQLARAVVDKGRRLAEQPSEAAPDARITDLAAMLRSMPRPDRVALLEKMATSDKMLTDKVREKLFKFADVLKLDDRSLQGILAQLNLKSIALALKGADEAIAAKVTNNISSRARELLQEEIGLLGTVPPGETEAAQKEVTNLIRQGEEEGKFVLGE